MTAYAKIADVPTKTSELTNDSGFVAASELAAELAGKQDIISDLATIRSGAAKGATALQSVPNSYRTAEAQDAIDAGKQNTLIQSGAAVGQIAKITAVDDTGKPTAWEAVDMPSGGGETWELINEITIPDDAEETNALVINKDLNGNPFELKKALLFVYMPKYTGKSTIPNYAFSSLNGIHNGGSAPATYTNFVPPSSAQNRSMWWRVSVANNGLPYHEELAKTNVSGSKRVIGGSGATALFDGYIIDGTEPAKESITEIGTKGNLIYAGCYFALYGVRK